MAKGLALVDEDSSVRETKDDPKRINDSFYSAHNIVTNEKLFDYYIVVLHEKKCWLN